MGAGRGGVCAAAAQPEVKPTPVVTIDNLSDPLATIVEISYGDLLGELLDTVRRGGGARLVAPLLLGCSGTTPCGPPHA